MEQINHILQLSTNKQPLCLFITGASGAGKTALTNLLEKELDPTYTEIAYFDRIGVPNHEEMIAQYGSGEKWQEATTHQWIEKLSKIQDKSLIILEGQYNPDFVVEACRKYGITKHILICVYVERGLRDQRLKEFRKQPELANDDMENWANVLKQKTIQHGGVIISNNSSIESMAQDIISIINKAFLS